MRTPVIKYVTPAVWRLWPSRRLSALQEFSWIERDSGCQLLYCQRAIQDPRLKAYLLQHVIEEFFHAEIFLDLAKSLSTTHLYEKVLETKELLGPEVSAADLQDFFAYVHIGEEAVNRDFLVYAKAMRDVKIRSVFARAGADEGMHENSTDHILVELCGHRRRRLFTALWKARIKRAWNLYVSKMNGIGKIPLNGFLSILYFISGLLVAGGLRRRLALGSEEQLKIFIDQVRDFERQGAR